MNKQLEYPGQRKEFERFLPHAKENRHSDGGYFTLTLNHAWMGFKEGWQAAKASDSDLISQLVEMLEEYKIRINDDLYFAISHDAAPDIIKSHKTRWAGVDNLLQKAQARLKGEEGGN